MNQSKLETPLTNAKRGKTRNRLKRGKKMQPCQARENMQPCQASQTFDLLPNWLVVHQCCDQSES